MNPLDFFDMMKFVVLFGGICAHVFAQNSQMMAESAPSFQPVFSFNAPTDQGDPNVQSAQSQAAPYQAVNPQMPFMAAPQSFDPSFPNPPKGMSQGQPSPEQIPEPQLDPSLVNMLKTKGIHTGALVGVTQDGQPVFKAEFIKPSSSKKRTTAKKTPTKKPNKMGQRQTNRHLKGNQHVKK